MSPRAASLPPIGTTAWYGKLPARGDFVSQGLPAPHARAWDAWLQQGLKRAARRWPRDELERRLSAFTPWRYLAWPSGPQAPPWAGVLLASRDRVGRSFPLTVAELVDPSAMPGLDWLDIEAALARMADVALDAIDITDPQAAEDFESVLRSLGPVFAPERVAARVEMRVPPPKDAEPTGGHQRPLDLLRSSPGTLSLWWSEPTPGAVPLPLGDSWPPHADLLLDILDGHDDPA